MSQSSLLGKTLHALAWSSAGTGAMGVLRLINLMVLARLLVPAEFGLASAALVVMGLATIVGELGIGAALVQRRNLNSLERRAAYTLSLGLGLLFVVAAIVVAPGLARFFSAPQITILVRAMSGVFLLRAIAVVSESLLQRELAFNAMARIEFFSYAIGNFAISIGLAALGFGVWALVWAFVAENLLRTIALLFKARVNLGFCFKSAVLRPLLQFGSGMTLARLANYAANQGDYLVIGKTLGSASLGEYSRAYQLMVLPATILGQVAGRVLFAAMSQLNGDAARLRENYRRGVAITSLLIAPVALFCIVLAPEIVAVLLGDQWGHAVLPLQILACGMLFRAGYKIADVLAGACGAVYRHAWRQGLYAIAVIAGAFVGSRLAGLNGAAGGVLVAILINYLSMAHLGTRLTGLSWAQFVRAHLAGALLAVTTAVAAWGVAVFGRASGWSSLEILILSALAAAIIAIGVMARWPVILGAEGVWMLSSLKNHAPPRVGRWLARMGLSSP